MPAIKNLFSPFPHASGQDPSLHSGVVSVTGSAEVNLGIGHNNFIPSLSLATPLAAAANDASHLSWAYGSTLGTFVIYAWKVTTAGAAGNPDLIAATAAVTVSFTIIVDSSAGI